MEDESVREQCRGEQEVENLLAEDRVERLHRVIDLCEEVSRSLDDGGHKCASCGLVKKKNLQEARAKETLGGIATRVAKVIEQLQGGGRWTGRRCRR
jgi:hypothetical protein